MSDSISIYDLGSGAIGILEKRITELEGINAKLEAELITSRVAASAAMQHYAGARGREDAMRKVVDAAVGQQVLHRVNQYLSLSDSAWLTGKPLYDVTRELDAAVRAYRNKQLADNIDI